MDRRPPRNWNTTTMTATTSSRWTNPPAVYELTRPSAHSTSRITAMVHSMAGSLSALDRSRRRTCDRVSVDFDEHHRRLRRPPDRPGDGGHGSRVRIDPVPRALRQPAPARARRPLPVAFEEAIRREGAQHLFRLANPTLPLLRPRHPALLDQMVERGHEAVHLA